MKVYYSPHLKSIAMKLRRNSTKSEIWLWKHLKGKKVLGFDFNRQKPIGKYIVDFYCSRLKLAIEVDGYTHRFDDVIKKDEDKSKYLESVGIRLLRFTDDQVLCDVSSVLHRIELAIMELIKGRALKSPLVLDETHLEHRRGDTPLNPLLPSARLGPRIEGKQGTVVAVCVSGRKGEVKKPVESALLKADHGIDGDAHAGSGRQVSLLAEESVDKMRGRGIDLTPGIFAENLLIRGLDFTGLKIGTRLKVGGSAVLEVIQIGKECHQGCAIRKQVGDCVMPREGVFARVVEGGEVTTGDQIREVSV